MWNVEFREVQQLQGQGGEPFTQLMDALIRARSTEAGLPDTELDLNPHVNYPDGGVDAVVHQELADDTSGYFDQPTAWQYKATTQASVNVGNLLDGDYIRDLVSDGYRFRLAIADGIAPDVKARWEERLTEQASDLCECESEALVVSVSEIVDWAQKYPAIILRFFRPELAGSVLPIERWGESISYRTPQYINIEEREGVEELLRSFGSFRDQRDDAVVSVQGRAGVGKTRLVYEALSSVDGADGYVVYCDDEEQAKRVATAAINYDSTRAVIVADECSVESRFQLERQLQGYGDRIRAIAIDNTSQRADREEPELWLEAVSREGIREILSSNYPEISTERIRAYAELAEGYPRLAIDLCENDDAIQAAEADGYVPPDIRTYLNVRLDRHEWEVVGAISLVGKVGYSDEVRGELTELCQHLNLNEDDVRDTARMLHRGAGFVGSAGRYYYITPQVIAKLVFSRAWDRWATQGPEEFIEEFPARFLDRLLDQIAELGSQEIRDECGNFFSEWMDGLTVEDLTSGDVVEWIESLCETSPSHYLPRLARVLEEGGVEDIYEISTGSGRGWGPRRKLVWLAQRWAAFEEYFWLSERILLRLALAENEPDIANNATAQWKQLYRIVLSGSALPFSERFDQLTNRWQEGDEVKDLVLGALNEILKPQATRTLNRAVVGGRIPPEEWKPSSHEEHRLAVRRVLDFISQEADARSDDWEDRLVELTVGHVRTLVARGFLEEVRSICSQKRLADQLYAQLLKALDAFLRYDNDDMPGDYLDRVNDWYREVQPEGLHGRLVENLLTGELYGRPSATDREADREEVHVELAEELLAEEERFEQELPFLVGLESYNAFQFGVAVGRHDVELQYPRVTLNAVSEQGATPFLRGYWAGVIQEERHAGVEQLEDWLEKHEQAQPEAVTELAEIAPQEFGLASRLVTLFEQGAIPVVALHVRRLGREATNEELLRLLEILASESRSGNTEATLCGLDSVEYLLFVATNDELLKSSEFRSYVWSLLEDGVSTGNLNNRAWGQILDRLSEYGIDRGIRLAVEALTSDSYSLRQRAEELLSELAPDHSELVMEELGAEMLDSENRWRFGIDLFRNLVRNLDEEVILRWLDDVGQEGALMLARHLPPPRMRSGEPHVPGLTDRVLERFGDDEEVLSAFAAGAGSDETAWTGSLADRHLRDAELASRLVDHDNPAIREWARREEKSARELAEKERIREEEEEIG